MPLAVAICGYLVKVSETTINTPGAFFMSSPGRTTALSFKTKIETYFPYPVQVEPGDFSMLNVSVLSFSQNLIFLFFGSKIEVVL